jgi:Protein of unknown function with PCYCGC motif
MQSHIFIIVFSALVLTTEFLALRVATSRSQTFPPSVPAITGKLCPRQQPPANPGHAYHNEPSTDSLPATLDPGRFEDNKAAFVAYSIAAKIRELLYQQPCYCGCDRAVGHESLLDCYTGRHGVTCPKCQKEVFFIYEQSKKAKSAAEIRSAMERGDVWKLDLNRYVDSHYAEYKQAAP